jgi:hypothetical protein
VFAVSKRTVSRLFVGGLVAIAAALVLLVVATGLGYASGSIVMNGPDVVGIRSTPLTWCTIGLVALATVTIAGGLIAQFVAWVGALLNTARLKDQTWFIVLLVMGVLSFGFVAMVVYIVAGPKDPEPVLQAPPATRGSAAKLPTAVG